MRAQGKTTLAVIALVGLLFSWAAPASAYMTLTTNGKTVKWAGGDAEFALNTTGMPGWSLEAVKASLETWSKAGANFSLEYGGSSASTSFGKNDGTNLIDMGKLDDNDIIALCLYWYDPRSGALLDADIRLNEKLPWSTGGDANAYDVQNIVTHELGHSLVLLDLYGKTDAERTMYGLAEKGETKKRTLDADDVSGIKSLYP